LFQDQPIGTWLLVVAREKLKKTRKESKQSRTSLIMWLGL